jgi:hypothetical protein
MQAGRILKQRSVAEPLEQKSMRTLEVLYIISAH